MHENLAEIYSLIICIDHIERAYIRDTIEDDDYTETMSRLLSRYAKLIQEPETESAFQDLDTFVKHYRISAREGTKRIKIGIPATSEAHEIPTSSKRVNGNGNAGNSKALLNVAGNFITFSDGIHLGFRGKNDLHPLLAELATNLNSVTKENFTGRSKMVQWLIRLNQLKQGELLSDQEAEQCLHDVEEAYESFKALLE